MLSAGFLKPFCSLVIIVGTLFSIAFAKMETRRIGYSVLKKTRIEKAAIDQRRALDLQFARLSRPARIELLASMKLDIKKAQKGQIVQMYLTQNTRASAISRVQ